VLAIRALVERRATEFHPTACHVRLDRERATILTKGDEFCVDLFRVELLRPTDLDDRGTIPQRRRRLEAALSRHQERRHALRRAVEWTAAMGQFAIHFAPRFPGSTR
jgi:hypothetical protein